jgi:hypothetical protein
MMPAGGGAMSVKITIKTDMPEYAKKLQSMIESRVPAAMALALTDSLVDVRDHELMAAYKQFFTSRNQAFPKIVHSVAASSIEHAKRSKIAIGSIQRYEATRPVGTLQPRQVGRRPASTEFMERHVRGGMKSPKGGRSIAVPQEANISRRKGGAKAGAVNKSYDPRNLLNKKDHFIITSKKTGRRLIVKRRSKRDRSKLKVFYSLRPFVNIKGGYDPERAVMVGMARAFEPAFGRRLRSAIQWLADKRGFRVG